MQIKSEELYWAFDEKSFWTRIYFKSDDLQRKSTLLVIGSDRYFKYNKIKPNIWIKNIIEDWKIKGEKIFKKKIHYDFYVKSKEGIVNGLKFLQEKNLN